jgi:2-polyprenyl-6-methoxyphenol hydroxylase-like FAD-dependent oxidoreductase
MSKGFGMSDGTLDCLIVGAGPVGLTLACQLQQFGTSYRIIDQLESPVIQTKAAAVWSRTSEFLAQMGLFEQFKETGLACYGASFFADGKRVAQLNLDSIDSLYNYVLMIPQHTTEKILRDYLAEHDGGVEYGLQLQAVEQSQDQVSVTLESGETIVSRWLVGCDGAHSSVRQALDLPFDGKKLKSQWIVADVQIEGLPLGDEILLFMHEEGPTGLFPLGDNHFRMVAETDDVMDTNNLGRAEFEVERLLKARISGDDLQIHDICRAGYFSIDERQVSQYKLGRVFLAGDSAHVHSPLGGQGMNTGMQDVNNLGWKLAMVAQGKMRESLLDTYHEERHPVGEWLVETTSKGTEMLTNRRPIMATFRKQAARFLSSLPPVQNKIRNTLSELDINYRDQTLAQEPKFIGKGWRFQKGIKSGERAPDGSVLVSGEENRLSTYIRGCYFHLLLFDSGESRAWSEMSDIAASIREDFADTVRIHFIGAKRVGPEIAKEHYLYDHKEELHNIYAATEPSAYLVRPDGYVTYRCQPIDQVELLNYIGDWCTS